MSSRQKRLPFLRNVQSFDDSLFHFIVSTAGHAVDFKREKKVSGIEIRHILNSLYSDTLLSKKSLLLFADFYRPWKKTVKIGVR